ncbi:hypothetical protein N865_21710 [Intrasporangium oryzae NRRL B-24470]|uniref:Uncharacterized protein n=1 Tax=Intrasporangium oryzae NRRL B-24470 TaxID=1386089 RepID=W9G4C8_9MICO|nr:hypothetical protein [Intrasporangium oryzae]EWS99642.1 hypothetical protein N865_21710 [Intrasporangium oryzae NRRL B-24470]
MSAPIRAASTHRRSGPDPAHQSLGVRCLVQDYDDPTVEEIWINEPVKIGWIFPALFVMMMISTMVLGLEDLAKRPNGRQLVKGSKAAR